MSYSKQTWVDLDGAHPLSAARMGHLEDGVEQVDLDVQAEAVTARAAEAAEVTNRNNAIAAAIASEVTNRNNAVAASATTLAAVDTALDARVDALEAGTTELVYRITTDLTRNVVTFADMVGLDAVPVDANAHYEFDLRLNVAVSVTGAAGVQITLVPTTVTLTNLLNHGIFPAGGDPGVDGFYETSSLITSAAIGPSPGTTPGAGVVHMVRVVGSFDTGVAAGTLKLRGRISTVTGGGTATFKTGSTLKLRKVTTVN